MHEWCARGSEQTGQAWRHARINQVDFDMLKPRTLEQAANPQAAAGYVRLNS